MTEKTIFTIGLKDLFDNYVEALFDITADGCYDDGSNNFTSAAPGLHALCTGDRDGIRKIFSEGNSLLLIPELSDVESIDELRIIDDIVGHGALHMVLVGDEIWNS